LRAQLLLERERCNGVGSDWGAIYAATGFGIARDGQVISAQRCAPRHGRRPPRPSLGYMTWAIWIPATGAR
jgi:hypothetical protein